MALLSANHSRAVPVVDLPSLALRTPEVRAPTPGVSPGQVASPYLELAHTLDTAAKETGDVSKLLAHEAGLKAVTRDADGNLQVDKFPIFGDAAQSFQHAVKYAALANGEGVARRDEIALRQQHHDDPEGYLKAADAYRNAKVAQYGKVAGPEVGIALGKVIDQQTTLTYKGLLNEKERLELARSTASIESNIQTATNELYALKAQGLPDDAKEVQERLQKIGAGWGTLMNNPRLAIPRERVEFEMSRLKSEMAVVGIGYRVGQIQEKDGIEAAVGYVDQVRTDPNLNLKPEERFQLHSRLMTGIVQTARAKETADRQVAGEIGAVQKLAIDGYPVSPERMGAVRAAVGAAKNPALTQALQEVEAVQPTIETWRKMSPGALSETLTALDQHMRDRGASEELVALRKTGDKLLATMRKEVQADPLGWADKSGVVRVPPLDFAAPDIVGKLRDRIGKAEQIGAEYGVFPSYLTPDERAVVDRAGAAGGQTMLQIAKTVVEGAGERAPKVFAEVSKEAPVLAHLGNLMVANGSPALMRDAAEAVQLRQSKEFKEPDLVMRNKALQEQHARAIDQYGGAFILNPDTGRAAEATAQAAYYSRSLRNGYDPLTETGGGKPGKDALNRTLQESAGATFNPAGERYGGVDNYRPGYWSVYKVLIPGNVRQDMFRSVVNAVKDEDLKAQSFPPQDASGKSYTAQQLRDFIPVWSGKGYRFAKNDPLTEDPQWMRGSDGQHFVLDIEAMESVLRKRVPGAYAGGR